MKQRMGEGDQDFAARKLEWRIFRQCFPAPALWEDDEAFCIRYGAWIKLLEDQAAPPNQIITRKAQVDESKNINIISSPYFHYPRGTDETEASFHARQNAWAYILQLFAWLVFQKHNPLERGTDETEASFHARRNEWEQARRKADHVLQLEPFKRWIADLGQPEDSSQKLPLPDDIVPPQPDREESAPDFGWRYSAWRAHIKNRPPSRGPTESEATYEARQNAWLELVHNLLAQERNEIESDFLTRYIKWLEVIHGQIPPRRGQYHQNETAEDYARVLHFWLAYQEGHPPQQEDGGNTVTFMARVTAWQKAIEEAKRSLDMNVYNWWIVSLRKAHGWEENGSQQHGEQDSSPRGQGPATPPSPLLLPVPERTYYQEIWGFDPAMEYQDLQNGWSRFETCFPLANDPPLDAAGVTICARVDWRGEKIHNRIVFRRKFEEPREAGVVFWRGDEKPREAAVECTHTVVYAGPAGEALNFAADAHTARDRLDPTARELVDRAGGPVTLPPWEHFASLKSYVAAIVEMGILTLLRASVPSKLVEGDELPFGFNADMHLQVTKALRFVAADLIEDLLQEILAIQVEEAPPDFIIARWESLNQNGALIRAFAAQSDLLLSWVHRWFDATWARKSPANRMIPTEVVKELTNIWKENWVKLGSIFNPQEITRIFQDSNLLDGLQDYIFLDKGRLETAKQKIPGVPWEQLCLEWVARRAIRKHIDNLDVTNERPLNPEEVPHAEIYPRGAFCEGQLLAPFTTQFPHLNARAMVHQRLADLGAKLSKDDVEWIFIEQHPRIREEMDEEYQKNMTLARDPHTPPDILGNLAQSKDDDVREQLASHPATPPSALEHLVKNGAYSTLYLVQRLVAMHPAASPPILEFLSNSRDSFVKLAVMAHPATPASVLEKLSQDKEICGILAPPSRHRSTHRLVNARPQQFNIMSLEQVQKAAKCALAAHPQTPDFVLDRFASDEDPSTRGAVAGNSRTPPAILKRLSEDNESSVKKMAAKNPATPVDVIEFLKRDNDAGVRVVAINNPASMSARTPEANDTQSPDQFLIYWRDWLNGRGKFPSPLLFRHMPPEYVKEVTQEITQLGAHITCILAKETNDPKLLISLARHWDLPTKLLVVVNPRVTQDILEIMTQDVQPSVRAIAGARLRRGGNRIDPFPGEILTPGEILWLLISREGNEISFAADRRGDYSPDYAAWISSFRGKEEPPLRFQTYKYDAGIIRDNYDHDRFRYIHLALDGIRDLVIGRWPCMYMFEF